MQKYSTNKNWLPNLLIASIAIFTTLHIAADEAAKNKKAVEKEKTTKWSAEADLTKLKGRWRISEATEWGITEKSDHPLVKMLRSGDGILIIEGNKFHLPQSGVAGKVSNDMNQIEVIPKRWLNTAEPRLQFVSEKTNEMTVVSYIVTTDHLQFRYPRNSCSRSGQRFTLTRETDTK